MPDLMRGVPIFHRPRAYRYLAARHGRFRAGLNRYDWQIIGVYAVVGRWVYCLKWGWAR